MYSRDSAGRRYHEGIHPYRGPFARDRDRILHSSAFRRLSGKMQVFTGDMGTYHRTRLTHTFEVASIARTIARKLQLNEDLTEALALMHDIGHPPFGHCGEDVLSECMESSGGFSHNQFALTIVEELEQRYSGFPGLNLSRELLAGQDVRAHKAEAAVGRAPILEVQVVDAADSIAYDAHDVDDALQMGLLTTDELSELKIVSRALDRMRQRLGRVPTHQFRQNLVHELLDLQVTDLLDAGITRLQPLQGRRSEHVCGDGVRLTHHDELAAERAELETFMFESVYRHPRLMTIRDSASRRLRQVFETLEKSPDRLPLRFRQRITGSSVNRVVGEYIAGMTDQFCDSQFEYIQESDVGPLADW
ncbi:MAG: dGTP triphosphohydrolase [Planctomycetota bacterium]